MFQVSIIIPNFNGATHLREAIDSALGQREEDCAVEVIVVDDGSTDGSRAVIDSFGDRIRFIYQDNKGANAARNAGLRIASGRWIKFLDSDDYLLPRAVRPELLLASEFASSSDKKIVYGDCRFIDGAGSCTVERYFAERIDGAEASAVEIVSKAPLISCPLYPRECLVAVDGFDSRLPAGQEYDLHVRLHFSGWRFIFHEPVCFSYRRHQDHERISTKDHSAEEFSRRFEGYGRQVSLAKKSYRDNMPLDLAEAFAGVYWDTGRFALRCDQSVEATRFFERARELTDRKFVRGRACYRLLCKGLGPCLAERWISRLRTIFFK